MKERVEQPEWLRNQTYGLERGDEISIVIDGEKYAVVKFPGKNYRSGQETRYGSVHFLLIPKFPAITRQGTSAMHGITLREGGRMTRLDRINWIKRVVESDAAGRVIDP